MNARRCPTCGKPANAEFRPFCSRRCADVDLQRWLRGAYAAPTADDDGEDVCVRGEGGDDD